jgi:DmsE family decaheme c-type cytochrome
MAESKRVARATVLLAFVALAAFVGWGAYAEDQPASDTGAVAPGEHRTDPRMPATAPDLYAVGSSMCVDCHPDRVERSGVVRHLRIVTREEEKGRYGGCEACHGRGSAHLETADPETIFGSGDKNRAWLAEGCFVCHQTLDKDAWTTSDHWQAGITCNDCHSMHEPESGAQLLKYDPLKGETERDLCLKCHDSVRARLQQYSHHPVFEGRVTCSDCHDSHTSSVTDGEAVIEPCVKCHADKEPPFVFEHEPVSSDLADGCVTCHKAHGTPTEKLLRLPGNAICIQCHTEQAAAHYGGATCWQSGCHQQIHGSDASPYFFE